MKNISPLKAVWHPALIEPSRGLQSQTTARLTGQTLQEIAYRDKKYKIDDYLKLLENEEVINAIVELKALRASISIGPYVHANKKYQDWVDKVFQDMEGTIKDFASKMAIASYFGFAVAEVEWKNNAPGFRHQWRLKRLNPLAIKHIRFAGTCYGVTHVVDRGTVDKGKVEHRSSAIRKMGGSKAYIPIEKCIHICRGSYEGDPYGVALARRAMPYWLAKKTLLSHWVVAGKNMANGMLIGYADSTKSVSLLDSQGRHLKRSDGQPITISAVENLLKQMEKIDEKSAIATDKDNQINWQGMSIDSGFFQTVLQYIDRKLLLTQLAPALTFDEGSGQFGNTGVSMIQKTMLDSQIEALMVQLKDQLIEKVVRPMLVWNFGVTADEGWGDFEVEASQDPSTQMMKAQSILQAINSQLIPSTDNTVINILRDLLGLPKQTENEMYAALQQQIETDAMKQKAMIKAQQQAATPQAEQPQPEQTKDQSAEQNQ